MTEPKFKEGDIVHHKASSKRGVIAEKIGELGPSGDWMVAWDDDTQTPTHEAELYTEEEYQQQRPEGRVVDVDDI